MRFASALTALAEHAITVPICAQVAVDLDLTSAVTALRSGQGLVPGVPATLLGLVDDLLDGVAGINLDLNLGSLCLCATVDALTDESLAEVRTRVTENGNTGLLGALADLVPSTVDFLEPLLIGILSNDAPADAQCTYPDGATPLTDGATCGSACEFASRKRTLKERSRFACRQSLMTACPTSSILAHGTQTTAAGGFECIDTRSNLESCGGCIAPFEGNAQGQDCTAIPNVSSVGCKAGRCIVQSCAAGYTPSADLTFCQA